MTNDILYAALESPLALSQPIIGTSNQILHQKYLLSSASSIHLLLHISLHFSTWEDALLWRSLDRSPVSNTTDRDYH
jgi:hypothetical protein